MNKKRKSFTVKSGPLKGAVVTVTEVAACVGRIGKPCGAKATYHEIFCEKHSPRKEKSSRAAREALEWLETRKSGKGVA